LVADDAVNGAFVYGPGLADWHGHDLATCPVELWINDRLVKQGAGANALGHPVNALVWLANLLAGPLANATGGLKAGQIVTTGTCAGIWDAAAGDRAVARFGPCGAVELDFAR
jgi:2-keto-4-pentenoate hydratase